MPIITWIPWNPVARCDVSRLPVAPMGETGDLLKTFLPANSTGVKRRLRTAYLPGNFDDDEVPFRTVVFYRDDFDFRSDVSIGHDVQTGSVFVDVQELGDFEEFGRVTPRPDDDHRFDGLPRIPRVGRRSSHPEDLVHQDDTSHDVEYEHNDNQVIQHV